MSGLVPLEKEISFNLQQAPKARQNRTLSILASLQNMTLGVPHSMQSSMTLRLPTVARLQIKKATSQSIYGTEYFCIKIQGMRQVPDRANTRTMSGSRREYKGRNWSKSLRRNALITRQRMVKVKPMRKNSYQPLSRLNVTHGQTVKVISESSTKANTSSLSSLLVLGYGLGQNCLEWERGMSFSCSFLLTNTWLVLGFQLSSQWQPCGGWLWRALLECSWGYMRLIDALWECSWGYIRLIDARIYISSLYSILYYQIILYKLLKRIKFCYRLISFKHLLTYFISLLEYRQQIYNLIINHSDQDLQVLQDEFYLLLGGLNVSRYSQLVQLGLDLLISLYVRCCLMLSLLLFSYFIFFIQFYSFFILFQQDVFSYCIYLFIRDYLRFNYLTLLAYFYSILSFISPIFYSILNCFLHFFDIYSYQRNFYRSNCINWVNYFLSVFYYFNYVYSWLIFYQQSGRWVMIFQVRDFRAQLGSILCGEIFSPVMGDFYDFNSHF